MKKAELIAVFSLINHKYPQRAKHHRIKSLLLTIVRAKHDRSPFNIFSNNLYTVMLRPYQIFVVYSTENRCNQLTEAILHSEKEAIPPSGSLRESRFFTIAK